MNKYVTITHKQDNLNQETWKFMYHDLRHQLILVEYHKEERPTTRHKFKAACVWDAYQSHKRYDDSYLVSDPPLPEEVEDEAIKVFLSNMSNDLSVAKGFK